MEVKARFDHYNINVADLEKSIEFYNDALGLAETGRYEDPAGKFVLIYMGDGSSSVRLELTCLKDHPQPYDLGENETHIAFRVDGDYDEIRRFHKEMGVVCFENHEMGLYFIEDPDGYWIEILPAKKS